MKDTISNLLFTDYVVKKNTRKTTIKAIPLRKALENVGIYILYLVPPVIIYYLLGTFISFVVNIVIFIVVFIISRKFLSKLFSFPLLILDSEKHILTSIVDKFTTDYKEIQAISLVEDVIKEGTNETILYRLRFTLHDGEKITSFAFTSYDKLYKMLEGINQQLKQ